MYDFNVKLTSKHVVISGVDRVMGYYGRSTNSFDDKKFIYFFIFDYKEYTVCDTYDEVDTGELITLLISIRDNRGQVSTF